MFKIICKFILFFSTVIITGSTDLKTTSITLAQAAYCNNPLQNNNQNILEYDIDKNSMRVLVGFNNEYNSTFVSYRGSENIVNWINNIRVAFTYPYLSYPDVGVETGFYKSFQSVYQDVINDIFETCSKYKTNKLILTGHSLGGTLADYVGRMTDEKAVVMNPGETPFSLSVIPKSETSKILFSVN